MRIATLFSGIGAPEQGAMRVYGDKLETVFACEFDKFARQSYEANYDIAPEHFHKDVNDLDATQYRDKVDILIGGSPCQAFSIAGLRHGTKDERGQLIYQYIRVVEECKPEVIVYENVKGMMSITGGRTIKEFVQALRDIGYYCHYDVINTKDYGVPQNRERLFLVGFLDHEAYHRFHFAEKQPLNKRLKDVLEDDVDEKYYLSETAIKGFKSHTERMQKKGNGFKFEPKTGTEVASSITTRAGSIPDDNFINMVGLLDCKGTDQIRRVYGTDGIAATLTTMQGGNQEPKIQVPSATKQGYETATTGDSINLSVPNSKTRRGRVDKQVAQCLDTACNQAVVEDMVCKDIKKSVRDNFIRDYHKIVTSNKNVWYSECESGYQDNKVCLTESACLRANNDNVFTLDNSQRIRKLTPRECLRLQDFPDTFKIEVSDSQAYKQAGNSMSVNILEMIFNQIEKAKSNAPTNTLMDFIGETA